MTMTTQLRCVSLGLVSINKPQHGNTISVVPIELFPSVDGEIIDDMIERETSGKDKNNVSYTVTVSTSNSVVAEWLPEGSNRATAPNVVKGEQVRLWKYADHDQYYWTTLGLDDGLRRLETVTHAYSATPDHDEPLDMATNMYTLTVSTHDHHITLHTTRANEEPFEYTLQFDTLEGKFILKDQEGNEISLDSANRIIKLINSDKTEVRLDKTTLYGYSKDLVDLKTDGELKAKVAKNASVTVEKDLTVKVTGKITGEAGGDISLKAGGAATVDAGGDVTVTAGGGGTVSTGGPITLTNGAATVTLNGPIVGLN